MPDSRQRLQHVVAEVIRLSSELEIASLLKRRGELTAVEIARATNEMLADTMYWLRGMLRDELIKAGTVGGETRYALTDSGRRLL